MAGGHRDFGVFAVRVEHALAEAGWQDSTSQSIRARDIVQHDFAGLGSTALQVVFVDHNGAIAADPAAEHVVAYVTRALRSNPSVSRVVPPRPGLSPSGDGRTGIVTAGAAADPNEMVKAADSLAGPLHGLSLSGDLGHPHRRQRALGQLQRRQPFLPLPALGPPGSSDR